MSRPMKGIGSGYFHPKIKWVNELRKYISVSSTYRAEKKSLYMVARYFLLLLALLSFSAWPCLAVA